MSRKVFFGKNDIRFFYYRYRDSNYYSLSITIMTIIVCVLLILNVIIPQAQKHLSIVRKVELQRQKLDVIRENINYMNNLDKSRLDSHFQTLIQALPIEKDFVLILNSLLDSALRSGVTLNDFTFNIGKVNTTNANLSFDLAIEINGSIDQVKLFLKEINEKLPISEVVNVSNKLNKTYISLKFHYKTYPKITFNGEKPIASISDADIELINKLSSWKTSSIILPETPIAPSSSSSAVPLFE